MSAGPRFTLQELSDRLEIDDLLSRYTFAIDERDFDALDDVFTPDATIDYTTSGGIKGSYPEVKARFFADADWKVVIDTVSPRVFEAAGLGCTLVQHEGLYGGILRPDEHYICVRRDYSNTADVIDRVQDRGFCREMAKRTHRDLIASGRYGFQAFARWFDGVLDKHVPGRGAEGSVSAIRFYGEGYLRRRQAIVPWGTGFVVTPSAQLVHHLARHALELLPRARRGPLMSRLIHNPAGIARKGLAAWRLLRHDRALRDILAVYRRQPGLRRAVRLHALLDDLLRLDLIVAARRGTLRSRQPFTVEWEFDPAEGYVFRDAAAVLRTCVATGALVVLAFWCLDASSTSIDTMLPAASKSRINPGLVLSRLAS